MTLQLGTLGHIHLRDEAGTELRSLLTQSKRLGLLVYLASICGDGRMCRRDSLMAMFWPESDGERARGALRQSIHFIRHVAGRDIVVARGTDELGLVPGAILLDASRLDALAAAGEHAAAVALYSGEFLDGFFVRGAPAFDQWVEGERARLRKRAADSAWSASEACAESGDTGGARALGERALALSTNNETAVRRFITLLAASGDRAAALAVYQKFADQMIQEFGVGPSPETRALVATLDRPALADPTDAGSRAVLRPHRRWWHRPALIATSTIVALSAATLLLRPRFRRTDAGSDPNRMVVLPFVVRGPASLRYLEDGLPILLGTRLDGAGSLRTVDPRALIVHLADDGKGTTLDAERASHVASHFDARLYVLGTVVAAGDSLRFNASLYDRAHGPGPIAHTEVDGTERELVHLVDRLAGELLAARFRDAGGTIAETAARTTTSLPALKAWLAGEAAITAGRYAAAIEPLREAIAADSNFAMAHFRLAVAANWAAVPSIVNVEAQRAVALSDRMSPSTRLVLQAFLDMRHGAYTHAAQALRTVIAEQPSATEAWYEMGEALFHGNPPQGRPLAAAREPFETALRLDPHNFSAAMHLSRIAAATGDAPALDRLSRAALDSSPEGAQRGEMFLLRALGLNDQEARRAYLAQRSDFQLLDALWRDTEYTGNLAEASDVASALMRHATTDEMRGSLQLFLAHAAMGRERFDEAAARIDSLAIHAPQSAAVTRLMLATHPALPAATRRAFLDRALAATTPFPPSSTRRRLYLSVIYLDTVAEPALHARAYAQLMRGDSAAARHLAGASEVGTAARTLQARLLLALASSKSARLSALRNVESVDSLAGADFTPQSVFMPRALYHFAVASALRDEGRFAEALARLQALPEDFGFNIAYTSELHRRRAALLDTLGRRTEALASRRAVLGVVR